MRHRYATLDGLRGIAALMVVLHHAGQRVPQFVPAGYLAVDFFFALSGFVLAIAYTERLRAGLTLLRFALERLVRVYPMYLIGFLLGLGITITQHFYHGRLARHAAELATTAAFNVFGMPDLSSRLLYPLNGPSWSLLFEIAVNLLFALGLFYARTRTLLCLFAVSAIAVPLLVGPPYFMSVGWRWSSLSTACLRTLLSFSLGVLLSRRFAEAPNRRTSLVALAPVVLLGAALLVPHVRGYEVAWDMLFVLLVSPLLIVWGAIWNPPAGLARVFGFLGNISFALYATHHPFLSFLSLAREKFGGPDPLLALGYAAGTVALATVLTYAVDAPVRRSLWSLIERRRAATTVSRSTA